MALPVSPILKSEKAKKNVRDIGPQTFEPILRGGTHSSPILSAVAMISDVPSSDVKT